MPKVIFDNLVKQMVPPMKRLPVLLAFLRALVSPLLPLWTAFVAWRSYQRMLINVYGCKIVLEGFLRSKYGTLDIRIASSRKLLPRICLRAEGRNSLKRIGLQSEDSRLRTALRSEAASSSLGVDFVVFVPVEVDVNTIRADIEQYKPHFATYKIVAAQYLLDDNNNRITDDNGNYIIITF